MAISQAMLMYCIAKGKYNYEIPLVVQWKSLESMTCLIIIVPKD